MDANDDLNGEELNLNCFYMHTIFGQKYPKPVFWISVFDLFISSISYLVSKFDNCFNEKQLTITIYYLFVISIFTFF